MSSPERTKYTQEQQIKAAYALNMCTVSVSQIVDYNDSYILEQEYETILNNLNLEQMPKDDALLKILVELLNTITFFRIQDMKKAMIEQEYQHKMKNMIWSAIPNFGLIVAGGSPITMAISLASQVGIGYMNYRREKANTALEKEKIDMELQITAIEQFNALKRELFTTAWRLADEYQFPDRYRLTEKQIRQYNAILMDPDEVRKLERLESIKENFVAYPPFWYYLGHTANYIAGRVQEYEAADGRKEYYTSKAKQYFEEYEKANRFNLLREDQMTAAFALEYIDLLMLEEKPDYERINRLLELAVEKSGNANDVMQLCAIAYLRIGKTEKASQLLKILVNEDFNTTTNAKLLSRLYASDYLTTQRSALKTEYSLLASRVGRELLFPMPEKDVLNDDALQQQYMAEQKSILVREYRNAINLFTRKYIIKVNRILMPPSLTNGRGEEYFSNEPKTRTRREQDVKIALEGQEQSSYIREFSYSGFRYKYVDILNEMLSALESLTIYENHENKKGLEILLRKELMNLRDDMNKMQEKLDAGEYSVQDFIWMQNHCSLLNVAGGFFDRLKNRIMQVFGDMTTLHELDMVETELAKFCMEQDIPLESSSYKNQGDRAFEERTPAIRYSIFGEKTGVERERQKMVNALIAEAKKCASSIVHDSQSVAFFVAGEAGFNNYFKNSKLDGSDIKPDTIAILDDLTKKDFDLLLSCDGFIIVKQNKVLATRDYDRVRYVRNGKREELLLGWPEKFTSAAVNIAELNNLMERIEEIIVDNK